MSRVELIPIILVDNREQLDYKFNGYNIQTMPATLDTGDYSIAIRLISKNEKSIVDYILKYFGVLYIKNIKFDITEDKVSTIIKFDNEIVIERKTLEDFTSVISEKSTRERFESSVKRGSQLRYYAVFIEVSEMEIIAHKYTSKILPQSVLNTAIRWSVKYRVPIVFCDNRINSEYHTYESLIGFINYKKKGTI